MVDTNGNEVLEKIKQYATTPENQEPLSSNNSLTNDPKNVLTSLLLPNEWLRVDHAYAGAEPALPADEYRTILEVRRSTNYALINL